MTATQLLAGGLSIVGPVRKENEDTIRIQLPAEPLVAETWGGLFAVADGISGYAHGGLASALAIKSFFAAFSDSEPELPLPTLRRAMEQTSLAIWQAASELMVRQIGTTLTAANVVGNCLYLAHVGDSRAYLIREGRATCLTNDHSVAGELLRRQVITPDDARVNFERGLLTKYLGASPFIKPDFSQLALQPDDAVILCSDGLWAYIEDDEMARLAAHRRDVDELSRELIQVALLRQTDDNVSVIVIRVEPAVAPQPAASLPLPLRHEVPATTS